MVTLHTTSVCIPFLVTDRRTRWRISLLNGAQYATACRYSKSNPGTPATALSRLGTAGPTLCSVQRCSHEQVGWVILLIYAVLSFAFMWDRFYMTDDAVLYCDTLFQQVYVSIIRYGYLSWQSVGLVCLCVHHTIRTYRQSWIGMP